VAPGLIAEEVERSADPVAAAVAIDRIADSHSRAWERIEGSADLRRALVAVVGASPWLARLCATDASALDVLARLDLPVVLDPAAGPEGSDLARVKRLEVLRIAARDLLGLDDLEATGRLLSDLAANLLQRGCDLTARSAPGVVVIGMGKLGGAELNYSSDIDVLLVVPPGESSVGQADVRPLLALARKAWRVDLGLRPEGRAGPLARTLSSYCAYWDRWAATWEFQALLKARPVAGDGDLGRRFDQEAGARVWGRPFGAEELREVRGMKARAEVEVNRRGLEDRELKQGRGGIRDIEFAVQLLQMVHGRADPTLRPPSTLAALAALGDGGYVGAADIAALDEAYRFLRRVEHRLQLREDLQTHTLPSDLVGRVQLARVLGYRDRSDTTAVAQFVSDLHRNQATVRAVHERIFFRPLMEAFAAAADAGRAIDPGAGWAIDPGAGRAIDSGAGRAIGPGAGWDTEPTLPAGAVTDRLAAFGFVHPDRTYQAVVELTRGLSRSSKLMQQSLPVLLNWLSESSDPDLGLLGLRTLVAEPHARDVLTTVCRESPIAARQLCHLLGSGPRFARLLRQHPDLLGALDQGAFLDRASLSDLDKRAERSMIWRSSEGAVEQALGTFARTEILRIASRDVLGMDDGEATGSALTDVAEAVLGAAVRQVAPDLPFAIIAMGHFGGRELGYESDLDVLFVYDVPPRGGAEEAALRGDAAASALVRMVAGSTPATQIYRVDTTLRPEGRDGPPARSLDAYAAYYDRWAQVWERQALLRGRFVAGDDQVGARFMELASRFVWGRPLRAEEAVEIRRMKARVERERVPASEDPEFHLKLGPGSLSDIEWTVQLLQLQHGVHGTGTLEAMRTLQDLGVLDGGDAETLRVAYRFCEHTRNRLQVIRDAPADSLPATGPALTALARSLGRTPSGLRDDYRRYTRRARRVVERVFYGDGRR
jgi:glutamate-ammonia-ligase adenylyltransferase